ncbi:NADH-quinone oxidoreductase subunit C [Thermodesulfovibrio yellowstonii]|uniref:NADH-quinone oxidoreductase subunit C n=1 Tax=Thermodesulfovibrio yellowstonii TaxID=28262 RepID=A0A9W6GFZ2_9BACT|nr:NADH-quinone oxidoreductase subunit C [Thermodesulfovibrio islandicus]GLI53455.1 NADH-quinone oxidoreductase subunit C [Thermodesulfovibrio islandicus]
MNPVEIIKRIRDKFSDEVLWFICFRDECSIVVKKEKIKDILSHLKNTPELEFDYLIDLTAVDYLGFREPRFDVVYYLMSIKHKHRIRVKAQVPEQGCCIDSVADLWATANWFERECYDMFGIEFTGHPDLRRILMPEDWNGFPLRKDYPVKSELADKEWGIYKELKESAKAWKENAK